MERDRNVLVLRFLVGAGSVIALLAVFTYQHLDFANLFRPGAGPVYRFYFSRTMRFLLNDGLTIALIWALFNNRQYVIFSLWVQLFGLFFVLIPYFIFKYYFPTYNGPLLSFLHRLILNPTLLLLLIPAFYYQKSMAKN